MTLDDLARLCQHCTSRNPVIILGSGASVPHGIRGMTELTAHLQQTIDATGEELRVWESVAIALDEGAHLEAALENKQLPASLVDKIVISTWNFITSDDYQLLLSATDSAFNFPLSKFLSGLLRTTHNTTNVVTTNYDRVAEYAADKAGLIHSSGFSPGYLRREEGDINLRLLRGRTPAKSVRVWKVHGSIDWFIDQQAYALAAPLSPPLPANLKPLIVTPGVSKFQRTHDEPFRSAIQGADRVLQNADAFVCIGYGFRDSHIHPKLVRRCRDEKMPILIAARTLTLETKTFLLANVGPHYVALEREDTGTRVYSHLTPGGEIIPNSAYWDLTNLVELCGF